MLKNFIQNKYIILLILITLLLTIKILNRDIEYIDNYYHIKFTIPPNCTLYKLNNNNLYNKNINKASLVFIKSNDIDNNYYYIILITNENILQKNITTLNELSNTEKKNIFNLIFSSNGNNTIYTNYDFVKIKDNDFVVEKNLIANYYYPYMNHYLVKAYTYFNNTWFFIFSVTPPDNNLFTQNIKIILTSLSSF